MPEADWKTFSKMVPDLRERYLERKNHELLTTLTEPGKTPTARFWDTLGKMKEEAKILHYCLNGHSRSKMFDFMATMVSVGMLTPEDFGNFSDELQDELRRLVERRKKNGNP